MTLATSTNGDPSFRVVASGMIAAEIRRLARQAAFELRGHEFMRALRSIRRRLRNDPRTFGDPHYRLPALRLQVRCAVVGPIVVYFAVSEDRPEVYIKAVKLF